MAEPRPRGRDVSAYLLVALASLCWAGNHVIGRAIAGHVPPIAVSTIRWIVPALLIAPFAARHLARDWPLVRGHWKVLVALSVLNGSMFGALQYLALHYTTAINTSVLNSVSPVLIILASWLMFGDRISLRQATGVATSLVGVLAVVTRGDPQVLAVLAFNVGDLIILFNMGVFAVYSAALRLRPAIHWLSFTLVFAVVSAAALVPAAVIEHALGYRLQLDRTTLATLAYVTIFPSLVAVASWNRGVELIGPGRAGAILHVLPIFSAVLATVFLGEVLQPFHFAGFALILAGVWMAARAR